MKVGVVGLGYVGLPLAVAFAEAGDGVIALDVDPLKVSAVNRRRLVYRGHSVRAAARGAPEDPGDLPLRGPGAGRRRDHLCPDAADRQPRARPGPARRRRQVAGSGAPARPADRARVDHVSRHDPRAAAAPARVLRSARRHRHQPCLLARARRPRAHRLHAAHHTQGRRRRDAGVPRSRRRSLQPRVRSTWSASPRPTPRR